MGGNGDLIEQIQTLSDSLVNEALVATDYKPIFASFCDRLANAGVPIFRVHIAMATLHPLAEGISLTWRREEGVVRRMHEHGSVSRHDWLSSPLKAMLDNGSTSIRF